MILNNFRFSYFFDNRKLIPPSKIIRKRPTVPTFTVSKQWVSKV